jgi:hypothetical protein
VCDVEEWIVFAEFHITGRLQLDVFGLQKMKYTLSHTGNVNQVPMYFKMLSNLKCQWYRVNISGD